jgi:hypothetical protein
MPCLVRLAKELLRFDRTASIVCYIRPRHRRFGSKKAVAAFVGRRAAGHKRDDMR